MNLYVGNLSRDVSEDELRQEFLPFGKVISVSIIKNKNNGESKGFAFVEMETKAEGEAAIAGLHRKTLKDRILDVSEASPRTDNRGGHRGGGSGGRFNRGSSGGRRRF
jgi:RNA recognition motif-containing protein